MVYSDVTGVRQVLAPEGSDDPNLGTAASMPDDAIEEAIAEADAQIDSRLGTRYAVPFSDVPTVVEKLSRDIAAYLVTLVYRRNDPLAVDDPIRLRYARALTFLDQLASGAADLIGATGPDASLSEAYVVNEQDGELFDRRDLGLAELPVGGGRIEFVGDPWTGYPYYGW